MKATKYPILDNAYSLEGGEVGCLLVHGFTGSPSELRPLGEELAKEGYTVHGVRLKGHGTHHKDLALTEGSDWYFSLEEALIKIQKDCDKVFLVGLSMGGLLSLKASVEYKVDGVVSINAPIFLLNKKLKFLPLIALLKKDHVKEGADNFKNRFAYNTIPLRSIGSLLNLIKHIKKQVLNRVITPTLIVQSRLDGTVSPKSGQYIYDNIASTEKNLVWLEKGGHVATMGEGQEECFLAVRKFLNNILGEK